MKQFLITLNIILAAILVWNGVKLFQNFRSSKSAAGFTVKKRISGTVKPVKKETPPATPPAAETEPVLPLSTQVENIIKANIFNQERCPNSGIFGNTRVEMTLVGTFTIGKISGAIILQKTQTREMPFMPWMMNQNQDQQQRQVGIGQRGGTGGNTGPSQNNQGGNSRRQMGNARNTQFNRSGTGSFMQNMNAQGTAQGTTQGNTTQQKSYKQYVRLGETLSNGYKLVEVTRTRVVLTRGGDKLELELADASKNQTQSTAAAKSAAPSQTQVMQQMMNNMQQMQQMQMIQGFQMMRNMGQQPGQPEQQSQSSSGRNGTAARGRR